MARQARPPSFGSVWSYASVCGAMPDGDGVRFRVISKHASAVELCLFDSLASPRESRRIPMRHAGDEWEVSVPGAGPGQLYGYRADGPYAPQDGHRFNRSKLLVDPWARAITGEPALGRSLFGYDDPARPDLSFNSRDSAPAMPRCVVVDPAFDWGSDAPPGTPWSDTVIYECHVRGLTRLHPGVEPRLRGTYLGLVAPPVLDHLRRLGVTAVELLPVHQIARELHLLRKRLANYWGYSTLGYFAPHAGYATGVEGGQVGDFKTMVRELHRAGIEVILDVVYNHTAEGDHLGPTLSFRGLDNATFYRLSRRNRRRYVNYTGCGNTVDLSEPVVRGLVLESLRYWVEEMHVDGFRFDLAPALSRDHRGRSRWEDAFDPESAFLEAVAEDPVLSRVKLVAEPWDLGPDGYRLGQFPEAWAEWNDRYRDALRRFWRGEPGVSGELARRLAGSADLFAAKGAARSVHYVTCHDGLTLWDLVSYEEKHNESNLEDNHDGNGRELSRNWGAEGPSEDPGVRGARERARRNLLATVFLSRGVPMLLHGDELGRTQRGNNNAYCQDNEITWLDWSAGPEDAAFLDFVRRLGEIRREHPALRLSSSPREIGWRRPDGREIGEGEWEDVRAFAMLVPGEEGELALLSNPEAEETVFHLGGRDGRWTEVLSTEWPETGGERLPPFTVPGFTLSLLLHRG